MDSLPTYDIENENAAELVTEADWIPSFWNFLLGLERNDLIAELYLESAGFYRSRMFGR